MDQQIMKYAQEIAPKIIDLRRRIHRYPELAIQEFATAQLVAKTLRELEIEVHENIGKTGVVGLLQGGYPGATVALRADMDALPIQEENVFEFRSVNPGVMHACGHDAHTAALLGAAQILAKEREHICGRVKFIFQPSEESPLGGAAEMIREGVLENPKVDAIIGLHVDPNLPVGKLGYREGPFYAVAGGFEIEIIGAAGHGAWPHKAKDAVLVAAEVVQALQTIAASKIDPLEPFVLTIGTIHGGNRANIIADKVKLTGTVRCFNEALIKQAGGLMEGMIKNISQAHDCQYAFHFVSGGKPLFNDSKVTAIVREAAGKVFGAVNVVEVPRVLLGEDFTSYSQAIPATFVSLGVASPHQENFSLHHPRFDIDEKALPLGAAFLSLAALHFLNLAELEIAKNSGGVHGKII
ncbi:MAG TPA: amidohydrolase [Firmicutes bacterium]|nr:amidohydrolase [Bacillota bacterium]